MSSLGVDVMGIRSFGLVPEKSDQNEAGLVETEQPVIHADSLYAKIMGVTPTQCVRASL